WRSVPSWPRSIPLFRLPLKAGIPEKWKKKKSRSKKKQHLPKKKRNPGLLHMQADILHHLLSGSWKKKESILQMCQDLVKTDESPKKMLRKHKNKKKRLRHLQKNRSNPLSLFLKKIFRERSERRECRGCA